MTAVDIQLSRNDYLLVDQELQTPGEALKSCSDVIYFVAPKLISDLFQTERVIDSAWWTRHGLSFDRDDFGKAYHSCMQSLASIGVTSAQGLLLGWDFNNETSCYSENGLVLNRILRGFILQQGLSPHNITVATTPAGQTTIRNGSSQIQICDRIDYTWTLDALIGHIMKLQSDQSENRRIQHRGVKGLDYY